MTKYEKQLYRHFKSLNITGNLLIVPYSGKYKEGVKKLKTEDGRPLNVLTQPKINMLDDKGYIANDTFDVSLLFKRIEANEERIRKRKENATSKKKVKKEGDIF